MTAAAESVATQAPRRLLAVDDDPFYQHLYSHFGRALFEHVDTYGSVNQVATETLDAADVLILDLDMPNTDGMHFLTEVLPERIARQRELQVIICSGLDERVVELARRAGRMLGIERISVLSKPFTAAALRNSLVAEESLSTARLPVRGLAKATVLDLREALRDEDVVPYWQPQVSTQDGRVSGLEILSRWHHPRHGVLLPGHFVDAMESDELGVQYALKMLDRSLESLNRWENAVDFTGRISLNAPPSAVAHPTFAERLMRILDARQFPEQRLVLEVTEHAASQHDSQLLAGLARILMHNIQLSIDDFGTGHSSLDRLGTEAFSEIKIDRSFVNMLRTSDTTRAITRSIIQAAKTEGLRIVAEGVSTSEGVTSLVAIGCTELQGSYFAMPLREDSLVEWLAGNAGGFPEAIHRPEGNALP